MGGGKGCAQQWSRVAGFVPCPNRVVVWTPQLSWFSDQAFWSGGTRGRTQKLNIVVNLLPCPGWPWNMLWLPAVCCHASQWGRTVDYAQQLDGALNLLPCPSG